MLLLALKVYESILHCFGAFVTFFTGFLLEMKLLKFLLDNVTKCCGKLTIFRSGNETKCTLHLFSRCTLTYLFSPCEGLTVL